jgi:hypothetical protein
VTELHRQQALFDSKAATHQQLETAAAQQGQFSGMVEGRKTDLARAEGSQSALLPPDNATGNITKVVQRVAVTIVFFRDSLISTGCGRNSRQSSPFIPATLEDDWTVINDRFCQHERGQI